MAELTRSAVPGEARRSAVRRRRSLATILAAQPAPAVHASGGRDQWSAPLDEAPADKEAALRDALGEVQDPELPISLLDLGLVYGVGFDGGTARVDLTFTATACPCMDFIKQDVRDRIGLEPWVDAVEINEVWDPPWTTARMTDEGRRKLGRFGVSA
ncbi:MAG: metal-sulfur cluster assembly factor [Gemmatimonadetes bacterium]|nr:metal-sulfur cluster assembly factor [Gemmatimonadota bacterium]